MQTATLLQTHPSYDAECAARYDALYRGGKAFRCLIEHFLPQNPAEPSEVYASRKARAAYLGYAGPILDFFVAKLMAAPFTARFREMYARATAEPPAFYEAFREDCDGTGTDLVDFARQRLLEALVKGASWWALDRADDGGVEATTRAEWQARGLDRIYLCPLVTESVLDWEVDERGELLWVVTHTQETARVDWRGARTVAVDRWRVWDRQQVLVFEAVRDEKTGRLPDVASLVGARAHGFSRVPVVRLGFTGHRGLVVRIGARAHRLSTSAIEGFWLMNRLAEPQIAHFRISAALDWNIDRTCYAMPVFQMDGDPPVMGAGYYIQIGREDKASWMAPPTGHLQISAERCNAYREEIYRVANQIAQGIDQSASSTARSAASKAIDERAAQVTLAVYGALVREAIERTYDLLVDGRGETYEVSVEGLDAFVTDDAAEVVETAGKVSLLDIPSATMRRELHKRVARAALPHLDAQTRAKVEREIEDGITEESTQTPSLPPEPEGEEDEEDEDGPESGPISSPEPTGATT